MKLIFVNSHPIQYFAPMYKALALEKDIDLKVIYFSDETLKSFKDAQFGVEIKWDVPLLEGYKSVFLKNNSWRPSIKNGFFGLMNRGIIRELRKQEKSIVVIHGWGYFSNIVTILAAFFLGHVVCLRGESPLKHEVKRNRLKQFIRQLFFKGMLFPLIDQFLYIGEQNRLFYKQFNVPDEKLIFAPYCVDNERFRSDFIRLQSQREDMRAGFGITSKTRVVLFSGKYIQKKRPLDVMNAMAQLENSDVVLFMMGDGILRSQMEEFIKEKNLQKKVILTGFVNQTEISEYYCMADIFVMCSEVGETWGLAVNEAMNFRLPIIVSDMSGCSDDLVDEGKNGFVFKTGDVSRLNECIKRLVEASEDSLHGMGRVSAKRVTAYSYPVIIENMKKGLSKFSLA